jgi:hypothetical protein
MTDQQHDSGQRRQFYRTMMLIALCVVAGRIATVISKEGDTAFLSANDRSRWCTVAALVEARTYEIDQLINLKTKNRRPWYTIDLVRHRGDDGQLHYYSSKPPLLPTLVAGVYWLFYQATGLTLSAQPIYAVRIVLALVNLPLLALFFWATIGSIERVGTGQWSRKFAAAATCFGTMLMPFAVSLNNHLVAAAATALVMNIYVRAATRPGDDDSQVGQSRSISAWAWLIAGMAAGFAAANELPALSMTALWLLLVIVLDWRGSISFLIGVFLVAAGFFATNKIAHDSLRPPYMHRSDGPEIALVESAQRPQPAEVAQLLGEKRVEFDSMGDLVISPSGKADRWVVQSTDQRLFALTRLSDSKWQLSHWDDWYDYPNSYWRGGTRRGVDLGEPSRQTYFAQLTVGHHGIFSLTPIWCLVPLGMVMGMFSGPPGVRRCFFAVVLATGVCIAFYVMRPEIDRNYGGVSVCFRWLLWFAPLWLLTSTPAIDWCATRSPLRAFLSVLLAGSVFSMATSLDSPWQHPWLYQYWSFLGWISG